MSVGKVAAFLLAGVFGAAPSLLRACACCGVENTWELKALQQNTYEWEEFEALKPGLGKLIYECPGCDKQKEWRIVSASRDGMIFRFRTASGVVVFRGTRRVEYRKIDISFATQPLKTNGEMSDIYHELVITGTVSASGAVVASKGSSGLRATLVLRGVGSMCFERGTFTKWLLRTEPKEGTDPDEGKLVGSGVLEATPQPDRTAAPDASKSSARGSP